MIHNHEVKNVKFPADPPEWNGISFKNFKEKHRILNRELMASGMNYRKIASKYDYRLDSLYRIARMPASRAYRDWLGASARDTQIADAHEVLRHLTDILREDAYDEHVTPAGMIVTKKTDTKDRLKAAETLAKAFGMFENKTQDTSNVIVVDIEGEDEDDDILTIESGE